MWKALAGMLVAATVGYALDFNVQFSQDGGQASLRILQVPAKEPLGAVHLRLRFRPEAGIGAVAVLRASEGAWSQVTPELRRGGDTVELWALAPGIGESRDSAAKTVAELVLPLHATRNLGVAADLLDSVWILDALGPQGTRIPVAQQWTTSSRRGQVPFGRLPEERVRGGRQTLTFTLGKGARVHAYVADARGKSAAEIFDRKLGPGLQEISWDRDRPGGRRLPSGNYFLRLEAGAFTYDRKLEVSP